MDPFAFTPAELREMLDMESSEPLYQWMLKRFNGMSTIVLDELAFRTESIRICPYRT